MKMAVIAPCLYPTRSRIHLLDESAARNGIELLAYGVGSQFYDWKRMMLEHTLPMMNSLEQKGYTHVLYVDGIDSIFMSTLDEIIAKYERYCTPSVLMSGDADEPKFNAKSFNGPKPWAFLNAGGFIALISFFTATVEILAKSYGDDDADYQNWFIKAWPVWGCVLDYQCLVFQSMNREPYLKPMSRRVLNPVTGTFPSVLHFRGGYCDPQTGRENTINPFLKEIYQ